MSAYREWKRREEKRREEKGEERKEMGGEEIRINILKIETCGVQEVKNKSEKQIETG